MTIVIQKGKQERPVGQIKSEVLPVEDTIVSVGNNKEFSDGVLELSLKEIYWTIKNGRVPPNRGKYSFIEQMEKLAALKAEAISTGDSKRYDAAKKQLPLFCWSGQFDKSNGVPNNASLQMHSGRLQIDIDGLKSPEEAANVRDKLGDSLHLETGFLSSGRYGVKAALWIPPCKNDAEHKRCFAAAKRYFWETYQIKIDEACKDVSRKCFFSYDPDLWFREDVEVLDIEKWAPKKGDTKASTKTKKAAQDPGQQEVSGDGFTPKQPDADIEMLKRDAEKYLSKVLVEIRQAPVGTRHNTQVRYAYSLGGLTAGGSLIKETTLEQLVKAARESRSEDPDHAERTVRACFAKGEEKPYWRDPIYAHLQENKFLLTKRGKDDLKCYLEGIDQPKAAAAFIAKQKGNVIVVAGKGEAVFRYYPQKGIWSILSKSGWEAEIQKFLVDMTKMLPANTVLTENIISSVSKQALRVEGDHRKKQEEWVWNPNPDRLVCRNGVFNLADGSFSEEFSREDYADRRVEVDYEPLLSLAPRWENFIKESIPNEKDRMRMQELVGYLLYPKVVLETILFIYGTGRNGKGVFRHMIDKLFMKDVNLISCPLDRLCEPKNASMLVGASLNSLGDASFSRRLTDQIKTIVSGEPIPIKFLYKDPVTYIPTCKHFIAANELPVTDDQSEGFYRRWNTYQFCHEPRDSSRGENQPGHRRASNKEIDKELKNKLEKEIEGVFYWALEGLLRLRRNKWVLTDAPGFDRGDAEMRRTSDTLQEFLEEWTDFDPQWNTFKNGKVRSIKRGNLLVTPWEMFFDAYVSFCSKYRYGTLSSRKLSKMLERKGFTKSVRLTGTGPTGMGDRKQRLCVNGVRVKVEYTGERHAHTDWPESAEVEQSELFSDIEAED